MRIRLPGAPGWIKIQTERPHTNVILLTKHSDADVGSPRRRFIHEARVQVELRAEQFGPSETCVEGVRPIELVDPVRATST